MGRKSLINRRAAKAADSMWRRKGMFARLETQYQMAQPVSANSKDNGDCPDFIPEKDSCYPLCDNPNCPERFVCNISAHMLEPVDEK